MILINEGYTDILRLSSQSRFSVSNIVETSDTGPGHELLRNKARLYFLHSTLSVEQIDRPVTQLLRYQQIIPYFSLSLLN